MSSDVLSVQNGTQIHVGQMPYSPHDRKVEITISMEQSLIS